MSKRILVTGSCGFIGFNFLNKCKELNYDIASIDKVSYCSNPYALKLLNKERNFFKIDICSRNIFKIINKFNPEVIINFAAESHVDKSIEKPDAFIKSNYFGVFNLISATQKYNLKKKNKIKFVQISTDEVFGSLAKKDLAKKENDNYHPSSPYSSTKAAADLLIKSWIKTYDFPAIIIHPSNNYGSWQFPEKLIPLSILKLISNEKVPIYGEGKNIREWIYVNDCVNAIIKVLENGKSGESYNLGSGVQCSNLDLIKLLIKRIKPSEKNYQDLINFVPDRPGHDFRYNIDNKKIKNNIKWSPKFDFEEGIALTVDWYLENQSWLKKNKKKIGVSRRLGAPNK